MKLLKDYWFIIVFTFPIVGFLINFYIADIENQKSGLIRDKQIQKLQEQIKTLDKTLMERETTWKLHLQEYYYHKKDCAIK